MFSNFVYNNAWAHCRTKTNQPLSSHLSPLIIVPSSYCGWHSRRQSTSGNCIDCSSLPPLGCSGAIDHTAASYSSFPGESKSFTHHGKTYIVMRRITGDMLGRGCVNRSPDCRVFKRWSGRCGAYPFRKSSVSPMSMV
jgi:hypothetical protein